MSVHIVVLRDFNLVSVGLPRRPSQLDRVSSRLTLLFDMGALLYPRRAAAQHQWASDLPILRSRELELVNQVLLDLVQVLDVTALQCEALK